MQLKEFQELVLEKLDDYLKVLKQEYIDEKEVVEFQRSKGKKKKIESYCDKAWEKLNEDGKLPLFRDTRGNPKTLSYIEKKDGLDNPIPNICIKVPTGGGKTLLGVSAVEEINTYYFSKNTGLVLWVVPSDAIYRQTIKNFKDRSHPYRQIFERAAAGKVKIFEKDDGSFAWQDIQDYLCVMIIMLQSANRETKESLRVFKDSGRFISFFPEPSDYKANNELLDTVKNLDVHGDGSTLGGARRISVKHSLGNAMRISRPIVVLDEGHRAYSDLARRTICGLNPKFILELSATPNMKKHLSNVLVSVSGVQLKEEEMIKLPINIATADGADWKKTLCKAYEKLEELNKECENYYQNSKQYIRPIMLIQVERTGKEQRDKNYIHTEDVKAYLIERLGIDKGAIKIKTAERNELKDESLLSETSQVRFIITKHALQEGWDCPYAYVLAILSNARSKRALTQLIGRILRQPYAQRTKIESLNESYVYCHNQSVTEAVEGIKKGLQEEGMDDLVDQIKGVERSLDSATIKRRSDFKRAKIFLPRVLHKDKKSWRDISYKSDILQDIDFSKISYSKKDTFTSADIDELKVNYIKIDMAEDDEGRWSLPYQEEIQKESIEMDFTYMVSRLVNTVPNPWQASRILEETINAMKANNISDEKIYLNRMFLLDVIEQDIKVQVEAASEKIFIDKLKNGDLCFKILKDTVDLNWKMKPEIDIPVSKDDKILTNEGKPLQLSIFEYSYEKHYNNFEKKVALYLDDNQAIKWWHRIIARQDDDYYLRGWQKSKVYPDFLACVDADDISKIFVLETKGEHLKGNDDTIYKDKLFKLLQEHANTIDVGTIETASQDETKMVFQILMEKTWRDDLESVL